MLCNGPDTASIGADNSLPYLWCNTYIMTRSFSSKAKAFSWICDGRF